ncbi:MAG: phycobilisome rod-core linker polypeptide [Synechococcales cyanobacterium C42_A2020_086]|nr:phycobilisome rod-core linker polypeptide [Synechococcales cyanobacterium C42_A2020_086]
MSAHANGGSPMAYPQRYHTLPTAVLSQAEQQDRCLKTSELQTLSNFFQEGAKRLEIAATLTQHANEIISAAANRIFYGGASMAYLEPPPNRENLPGYTLPPRLAPSRRPKERLNLQMSSYGNPLRGLLEWMQTQFSQDRDPLPDGFRPINVRRYGSVRMRRSMRDISWFLRYVTYAIVAGDSSILRVNAQGLRGVIPEDVTEATVVAIREMRWRSLSYFKSDPEAVAIIQQPFDDLIAAYLVEKPTPRLRQGISIHQQGLELPESYTLTASRHRFVMKPQLAETEKQAVIQAAYRQVFERDIPREYGVRLAELESRFRSGEYSTKEFVRQLGKSRLYRDLFYEPYTLTRVIELAMRHFLGRGLESLSEFQDYFDVISEGGLPALIDALVDSVEYSDCFGEETVPYLRGLGQEAQTCQNWSPQFRLFKFSAPVHKAPQFVTCFGDYRKPLPNQHVYGASNDPLEIQFGAIFPPKDGPTEDHPALCGRDYRRILIHCSATNGETDGAPWGRVPGSEQLVIRMTSTTSWHAGSAAHPNVNLDRHSPDAVIQAAYRQVFGRDLLSGQHLTSAESHLKSGEITVREFVRQLAKSRVFRSLYWDNLYITKAIEYIHRRLLGRPTYGREEMGRYYDLCAKRGFYDLIDALIDSDEYLQAFGEDTVPYERYITPRALSLRAHHPLERMASLAQGERVYERGWIQSALQRMHHYGMAQGAIYSAGGHEPNGDHRSTRPEPSHAVESHPEPAPQYRAEPPTGLSPADHAGSQEHQETQILETEASLPS